jgi:hypothetical protein
MKSSSFCKNKLRPLQAGNMEPSNRLISWEMIPLKEASVQLSLYWESLLHLEKYVGKLHFLW